MNDSDSFKTYFSPSMHIFVKCFAFLKWLYFTGKQPALQKQNFKQNHIVMQIAKKLIF